MEAVISNQVNFHHVTAIPFVHWWSVGEGGGTAWQLSTWNFVLLGDIQALLSSSVMQYPALDLISDCSLLGTGDVGHWITSSVCTVHMMSSGDCDFG